MDLEAIQALLDNQKKYVSDAVEKQINDLIRSLEYTQATVHEMSTKLTQLEQHNKRLTSEMQTMTRENSSLRQALRRMDDRLDYLDDQGRRNNLRICGVPEEPGENWEQCQLKITKIMKDKLKIQSTFERVHRVGRFSPQQRQPRDIVAKFASFSEREAAFRARRNLKGTQIFLNEDLCPGSVAARRNQMDVFHTARREGKFVYFNYRTLVIREGRAGGPRGDGRRVERPASSSHHPNPPGATTPNTPPATTSLRDFPSLMQHPNQHQTKDSRLPSSSRSRTLPASLGGGDDPGHALGANLGGSGEADRVLDANLDGGDDDSHDTGRMKRQRNQTRHYQAS